MPASIQLGNLVESFRAMGIREVEAFNKWVFPKIGVPENRGT